jgi:hypothetical protein
MRNRSTIIGGTTWAAIGLVAAISWAYAAQAQTSADAKAMADKPADDPAVLMAPPGGKAVKSRGKSDKPGMEAFLLPVNYRNLDGSFNQEALVAQQKKRMEVVNDRLRVKLRLSETPHYLIFSDGDTGLTSQFARWSEALYGNLCRTFTIDPKERVWDGKCVLILFASRTRFEEFGKTFDDNNVKDAGAYFAWETYSSHDPQCVHICIPLDERSPRRLQELFAHEGTHAFFQLFRKAVDLPLWLHEGLAEYMTVVNDPSLAPMKSADARRIARASKPLGKFFDCCSGDDFKIDDYSVAYTMVDCLQQIGGAKFKQFVCLVKEGKPQNEAMQTVYGFDFNGLQTRWRAFLLADSAPVRRR